MAVDNLGIGLDAYVQNGDGGFGDANAGELESLHKALSAGHTTGRETDGLSIAGSGSPLKVESLEKNLKVLTYKPSDIVAWRAIPKLAATNTVEEYNKLKDYGADRGGFNLEGELPKTEDTTYERSSQLVKYLGTTREVTHQMTLVKTNIGSAIQAEINSGTMWILRKVDRALFFGNSDQVAIEFNGLFQQHSVDFPIVADYTADQTVIDLRGSRIGEEEMEEGVRVIVDNFGGADCLFAPPIVLSNFTKFFYANLRQMAPAPEASKVGRKVTHFQSQFGEVELKFDKFLNRGRNKNTLTEPTDPDDAPNSPIAGSVTPVAADTLALWGVGDAGDYFFAVTAINRFGESAITVIDASAATIASGGSADLAFTSGGGANPAEAYTIYRSNEGAATAVEATFFPLFTITKNQLAIGYDGGVAGVVRDRNRFMPDTDVAFLLENSEDIWAFKQLAPLMKMDLARTGPVYRFMILLYGTPFLYQPRKMVKFINIGIAP